MANGNAELQIAYSQTYTALSFFVPIVVLLAAFLAIGTNDQVSKLRVASGGTLAGFSICGMHYVGQSGITNYICVYNVANVVGSAVIAVVASVTAITIFFVLRAAWTDSWWKRALCALLLAGAVSGMHWIASAGTEYRYKQLNTGVQLSRNPTVIVVIVLVRRILLSFFAPA
jgi:NO-binding membrane sensor protein with MHYT domain